MSLFYLIWSYIIFSGECHLFTIFGHISYLQVNVTYYAAMAAINSLNQKDLEELKSYRKPPEAIHIVGEALCIMFNQPSAE